METQESPALVLDRIPFGERDLILTLLTRDAGVVSAIARGARGSGRRFAGALDLFVVLAARWRPGRASLATLTGAEVVRQFPGVFERLDRLEAGQAMLVLARDLARDAPAGESMHDRLVAAFATLSDAPPALVFGILLDLAVALLEDLGHPVAGAHCPRCRRVLAAPGAVLAGDGSVVCADCGRVVSGVAADVLVLPRDRREPPDRDAALKLAAALVSGALGRPYRFRIGSAGA
jgi:DNA repair protein RecO (recombination protein O)